MAKLRCKDHDKRCMVLHPSKVVVHRSGDGVCGSKEIVYAGKTMPKNFVTEGGIAQPIDRVAKSLGLDNDDPKRKSRKKRNKA